MNTAAEREYRIYRVVPTGGMIPCAQQELARVRDETPLGALLLYAGRNGLVGNPCGLSKFVVAGLGILRAEPSRAVCKCAVAGRRTIWDVAGVERCRECRLPIPGPSGTTAPTVAPARPMNGHRTSTERSALMDATETPAAVEETDAEHSKKVEQPEAPAAPRSGRVDNTKAAADLEKTLLASLRKEVGKSKVKVTPKASYRRVNIGKPTAAYLTTLKSGALRVELPTGSGSYDAVKVEKTEDIPAMVERIAKVATEAAAA